MVEKQMKTFTAGDTKYIINDAEARAEVADLKSAFDFNGLGVNIFKLGSDVLPTFEENGLTITRVADNKIMVYGTCNTAFNFSISSKAYSVTGGATGHYMVKTAYATFGTNIYVQVGWFTSADVANNGKKISVSNEYVDITYADDAAKSREYIHFDANAVFDHVTFEFINTYDYPVDGILYELRNDVNTALNTGDQLTEDVAGIENALPQGNAFVTLTANYAFAYANQELSWTGDIVVIYAGTRNAITPANVGTQLGSAAFIDGSDVTVTIPQAQALIYRPADSTLKIVTRPNVKATDILIFVDYYGLIYGNIIPAITERQLKSVKYSHIDDAFSASRATIILSGNGRFSIDGNDISYSATLYIDSSQQQTRVAINAATANAQLPNNSTLSSGTVTITVPSNQVLTYDYYSGSLTIKTRGNVTKFDLLLFSDYYGVKSGAIYDKYWLDKFIDGDFASATDIFNAAPYEGTYDWQTPVVNFCKLFKSAGSTIDTFAFFTDPHIMGGADDARNEEKMQNYIKKLQTVYNSAPCDFIVGGGDWLNNSTSGDEACYRLGYIDGFMRSMFENYHAVVGNHDTNYQGTETLSNTAIANLWFRQTSTRKAYYKFKHNTAECYVLDSGIEHSMLTSYDYEQLNWFCDDLASTDPDHAIVFMHILTLSSQPMVTTLGDIISAYNGRQSIAINGTEHNFSACDGHIDFAVGGHTHQDSTGAIGGVPYFITGSNSYSSDVPLIDLVLVDYTARKINIVRAGNVGTAREISF